MSDVAASPYKMAANFRWFAVVYLVVTVIVATLTELAYQNGIELPTTGLNIGAFAGVSAVAGQRFATKRDWNWSSADRHQLALGYTLVSVVISFVLVGALATFDPTTRATIADLSAEVGLLALAIMGVAVLIFFVTARLTLGLMARRGKRN